MENDTHPHPNPPIALVVDDEPLVRMDMADLVAKEGFSVVEAHTADEALDLLERHHPPQLLITDIQTGGSMDGCELARQVKSRWPHVCVVVVSGAVRPADGELPSSAIFAAKPISADVVHEVIEEYCRKSEGRGCKR